MRIVESIAIAAPPERVTRLVRSVELHEHTAAPIRGRAVGGRVGGLSEPGDRTRWRATFLGVRASVTVETVHVQPGVAVRERLAGPWWQRLPLAAFGHTYRVDRRPGGCVLWDVFTVRLVVGEAATRLLLRRRMAALVRHRLAEIRRAAEDRGCLPVTPSNAARSGCPRDPPPGP